MGIDAVAPERTSRREVVAGWRAPAAVAAAALGIAGSLAVMFSQVEVRNRDVGVTRACGSAFDSAVDRSGWELWWARDLDEPDAVVRAALVRTHLCPDAINGRLAVAAFLAVTAAILLVAVAWSRRSTGVAAAGRDDTTFGRRVMRLGHITWWTGAVMAIAGVLAIVVLVADADSTLFLYTDRFVVAVVGLIVLVPTFALIAIGRALRLAGAHVEREREQSDG